MTLLLLCGSSVLGSSPPRRQSVALAHRRASDEDRGRADGRSAVIVNGERVSQEDLDAISEQYHQQIPAGSYWYDRLTGAWGKWGGPTLGITLPGLDLGGPLSAKASHGNTGVFINHRQLPRQDVIRLRRWLGVPILRGRWWVYANGAYGREGSPFPLGNLIAIARRNQRRSGEGSFYSNAGGGSVMGFVSGGAWSVSTKNADGSFTTVGN